MNSAIPTELVSLKELLIVLPMTAMLLFAMIPLLVKAFRGNREPRSSIVLTYNLMGLMVAAGLTAALFGPSFGAKMYAFSNAVIMDGITVRMSYLVYFVSAVALILGRDHIATKGRQYTEFCFMMISSAFGMLVLIMSNDLIVTFIGIETMSLCLYILVAMSREKTLSKEAAFKYFVLGSFASALMLYGVALLYGSAGSTSYADISIAVAKMLTTNRVFLVGILLVVVGFAFKVSVFPFHTWAPDVYQGASTPVTAFMATAVKAATFVSFLRFMNSEGFTTSTTLFTALSWLAVLTMTVGNVAAVMQTNIKRTLAYSSVAHSGYLLIGLIAAAFGTNYNGAATSVLFYLISYSLMTLGSFALVSLFEKNENSSLEFADLRGMGRKYPLLALSFTVLMLSLAGIPPTLGFFGKFYVFSSAIEQDMYWLVVWGVINSVISVYYYLRPIVSMYMTSENEAEVLPSYFLTRAALIVSALLIVILGILSSPMYRLVQNSVVNLF